MTRLFITLLLLSILLTFGCQEETPKDVVQKSPAPEKEIQDITDKHSSSSLEISVPDGQDPPSPPVFEDFQGVPQLTLFPRAGDFRPAEDDERLPYWNTFIEHLVRNTEVFEQASTTNRSWLFRSIMTIDSVGYFSPLAVEPETKYQVSFKLRTDLIERASAGIGILEFDKFLWIPSQYPSEVFTDHFRGSHKGIRQTGKTNNDHSFTFTTGPNTRMIHVILFREGPHDSNGVIFDDIKIDIAQ